MSDSYYSRQIRLPEIGLEGQRKLSESCVAIVGVGGLGCPAALYLAGAGVGKINLIDGDEVELSNLHRQVLYSVSDVGKNKAGVAAKKLRKLNPSISAISIEQRLTPENAHALLSGADIVIDATDNYPARYLLNGTCRKLKIPYVMGSVLGFEGQLVFFAPDGPCYACLYPEPPPPELGPACGEAGVLGVVPGLFGTLQAAEALKHLLGIGETSTGKLFHWDLLSLKSEAFSFRERPNCPVCLGSSTNPLSPLSPLLPLSIEEISVKELHSILARDEDVFLLDVREKEERSQNFIAGSEWIPLGDLPRHLDQLKSPGLDRKTVIYCAAGVRSSSAAALLQDAGFKSVKSLRGGMRAWLSVYRTGSL